MSHPKTSDYLLAVIQKDQEAQDRRVATADTLAELVAALNTALTELRAIQARDGAPQHIEWDRGRPLQTDSCTHDWWNTVVDRCEAALAKAQKEEPQ